MITTNNYTDVEFNKLKTEVAHLFNSLVGHRQRMFPNYDQKKVLVKEFPLSAVLYEAYYGYRRS
jgi:hypothetical protein